MDKAAEQVVGGVAPALGAVISLQQRKALLQRLVVGVDVNSRDEIIPTFRIPATPVRVMDRVVGAVDSNHLPPP